MSSAARQSGAPAQTRRSGLRGERRGSVMSDFSPKAEMSDMELAPTRCGETERSAAQQDKVGRGGAA